MNANHAQRLKINFNIFIAKRLSIVESPSVMKKQNPAVKLILKGILLVDQLRRLPTDKLSTLAQQYVPMDEYDGTRDVIIEELHKRDLETLN